MLLSGCGNSVGSVGKASATALSTPRTGVSPQTRSAAVVLLDVSDQTFHGIQTTVFTAVEPWELTYAYDCGAVEYATANISVALKGQGIFRGALKVSTMAGAGAGVVEEMAPGSFSLVIDIGDGHCQWHILAGTHLDPDQLLSAVSAPPPPTQTTQGIANDVQESTNQEFGISGGSRSILLFAYECGPAASSPAFSVQLVNRDPAHSESHGIVNLRAPRGWGLVTSLPVLSRQGYVASPGSLSLGVSGCKWRVIFGKQLVIVRPAMPG